MISRKKRWLRIGVSLFVLGAILFGVGFAMDGFGDFKSTVEPRTASYDAAEIDSIWINAITADVLVEKADAGRVEVTYFEGEHEGVDVMVKDGVLTIKQTQGRTWRDYIRFSWSGSRKIVVRVPEVRGDATFLSTSGNVFVTDVPVTGTAHYGSTSGKVAASGSAGSLAMVTTSGDIDMRDMTVAGDASAITTSGKIKASGLIVGGAWKAISTSGSLAASDIGAASFTFGSVSGKIRLDGIDAGDGAISAMTTSGAIDIMGVSAASYKFGTVSGDVTGMLPGSARDYTIKSGTVSGKNALPTKQAGGPVDISVTTTSGDIDLSFEEE